MSKKENRVVKHVEKDIYLCVKSGKFVKYNSKTKLYEWFSYPRSKTKPVCGVYFIYDRLFNKYYIGSSVDIISRVNNHLGKYNSNDNCKDVKYLVHMCHKAKYIEFGLLELCSKEDLAELERYYMRLSDSVSNGWNKTYNTHDNWLRYRKWSTNNFYESKL